MTPPLGYIVSCAAEDNDLAQEFRERLACLQEESELREVALRDTVFSATAGEAAFGDLLQSVDLVFLLLSPDAFAETWSVIHRALEQHDLGYLRAIPLVLRHCHWRNGTRLGRLSALPKDERSVCDHLDREQAWRRITGELKRYLQGMPVEVFYKRLAARGLKALQTGAIEEVKCFENPSADMRLGITLKVPISQQVTSAFTRILERLKRFAPENLYYQAPQFHLTILSLITCRDGFRLSDVPVQDARQAIKEILLKATPLDVDFRGLCATPNSIVARGFPEDDALERLRDALRQRLTQVGLGVGLDDRYRIQAAHVTLGRLRHGVKQDALLAQLGKLRDEPFGRMRVEGAQLVVNDFFMSPGKVQILATFPLQGAGAASRIPPAERPASRENSAQGLIRLPDVVVGREEERDRILKILLEESRPLILTSGFGGIGKSTLAAYAVSSCREAFDLIVWLDVRQYVASQRLSLEGILHQIAFAAHIAPEVSSLPLEARSQRIIQELCRHRALLIFDNYESLLSVPGVESEVSDFIRQLPFGPQPGGTGNRIAVMVTTRKMTDGLREQNPWDVAPTALSASDSVVMIKAVSRRKPRRHPLEPLTDSESLRVHELMHGLPKYIEVAIDQLSALHFYDWERQVNVIPLPLDQSDRFFGNLFALSWRTPEILSAEVKCLLLAMTHFVGDASFEALCQVSGLSEATFGRAVGDAYPHLAPSKQGYYKVHPLTHAFCKSEAASQEFPGFYRGSARRFIEFFAKVAASAHDIHKHHEVELELQNIVAAARLAFDLQLWQYVVELQEQLTGFLRASGHWRELLEFLDITEHVCDHTDNRKLLCTSLVKHHAWVLLRREELREADHVINSGMLLAISLRDRECTAQAKRHAGKSALLKADYELFDLYEKGETWHDYFRNSERNYQESLQLREKLHGPRSDQRSSIADMKMDFGRLFWLEGRKIEREGRKRQDRKLVQNALKKYKQALQVSVEAKALSESIQLSRGMSKSSGDCGNGTKEMARYFFREQQLQPAVTRMKEAERYYIENLRIGEQIGKRDEVSHALWGLAEVYEFLADHDERQSGPWFREELLRKALHHAQDSHRFYKSFGGGREIGVTERLADRIRGKILSEHTLDYFNSLVVCLKSELKELPSDDQCSNIDPFRQIMVMGTEAIPYLLDALKWEAGCWSTEALELLTRVKLFDVDPGGVRKAYEQCSLHEKVENWLTWGREQGFTA